MSELIKIKIKDEEQILSIIKTNDNKKHFLTTIYSDSAGWGSVAFPYDKNNEKVVWSEEYVECYKTKSEAIRRHARLCTDYETTRKKGNIRG